MENQTKTAIIHIQPIRKYNEKRTDKLEFKFD